MNSAGDRILAGLPADCAPDAGLGRPRVAEAGFTLLEVLCAFAILAVLTGMLTVNFVQNVERGRVALSHRELREAADTIFRKIIYETEEYKDGDGRTLDEEYGEFARLKGWQRDRWAIYSYRLEKKLTAVVGYVPDSEESLFESDEDEPYLGDEEGAEAQDGVELMRVKLDIFRTDEAEDVPLLTLVTWYDPKRGQLTR